MSGPEQGQGAPAAPEANAVSGEVPKKQPKPQADEPDTWVDRLLRYGAYVAVGGFTAYFMLPYAWNKTAENWPGTLAALAAMRECGGLRCTLDSLGLAIQLMTFPVMGIGLALQGLLYKRHKLLGNVLGALCFPAVAQVSTPGSVGYRIWGFVGCSALGAYLGVFPGGGDAGVFVLMGVSAGLMVVRHFLDRKEGA